MESLIVTQTLQIAILAGVVWFTTRCFTGKHAHLSYLLWLVVLVKCITPPIWASPLGIFSWLRVQQVANVELIESSDQIEADAGAFSSSDRSWRTAATELFPQEVARITTRTRSGELPETQLVRPRIHNPVPADLAVLPGGESATGTSVGMGMLFVALSWLPFVWVSSAVLLIGWTLCYACWFVRRLRVCEVESEELQQLTNRLSQQLKLKRPVQLLVTSRAVGPAVVGLFRPLIVIPQFIVERCRSEELEPILAHELVHVRRGDLWIGLLRHLARTLWWFHPLVWKTSHAIRHDAERCCDEEVIGSLQVSANDYARALLSVLDLKQELKAVPIVPGVRPFDITSQRLEQIMQLRQGSRQRTPRWCWAIALLIAAVSLPGAGLIRGEEKPTSLPDVVEVDYEFIPWGMLGRTPPTKTVIQPEDVLGVYVVGILGTDVALPPVQLPDANNVPPDLGFPIPVRADGTLPLPLIEDPKVAGMTVEQTSEAIIKSYTVDNKILTPDQSIIITMIRPKHVRVLVIRQDSPDSRNQQFPPTNGHTVLTANVTDMPSTGFEVQLPAAKADVLTVLAETGGMPGTDAKHEILVYRKDRRDPKLPTLTQTKLTLPIRIPLTVKKGEQPDVNAEDVCLQDGDIVVLGARNSDTQSTNALSASLSRLRPRATSVGPPMLVRESTDTPQTLTNATNSQQAQAHALSKTDSETPSEPADYVLAAGDVLDVYIQAATAKRPQRRSAYPLPVQPDGTVALPLIDAQSVAGLTVAEAQERIANAYLGERKVLASGHRVLVTLARKRGGESENEFSNNAMPPGTATSTLDSNTSSLAASTSSITPNSAVAIGPAQSVDALETWELSLEECVSICLQNQHQLRTLGARCFTPKSPNSDSKLERPLLQTEEHKQTQLPVQLVRINTDTSLTDLEINVRNYLFDVSQAYWNLYFHHHNLAAAIAGFSAAHATWKNEATRDKAELVDGEAAHEAHARAQYFAYKSRLQQAKSDLLHQEARLRYLLGLSAADGRLIQPSDAPSKAKIDFDWGEIRQESLQRNPELRRQRRRIEQTRLQEKANLETLLSKIDAGGMPGLSGREDLAKYLAEMPQTTPNPKDGEVVAALKETPMTVSVRGELAGLKNARLQRLRSEARLEDEELESTHQMSTAFRRLRDQHQILETQANTHRAMQDQVESARNAFGAIPLDVLLDVQQRESQARVDYLRSLVDHQLAIDEVHYRKGSLLHEMGCELAEQREVNEALKGFDAQLRQ